MEAPDAATPGTPPHVQGLSPETTLISVNLTFGCFPFLQKYEHFFIVEGVSPPTHLGLRSGPMRFHGDFNMRELLFDETF
jgi:hypothetical protein